TELVMGVLRRQEELDREIERLSGRRMASLDREVAIALRLGVYQMLFLERIPRSAAVNESVELVKLARKRSAASFVNAILRKFSGSNRAASPDHASVPAWLLERWVKNFGEPTAHSIASACASRPPTCLRICDPTASLEAVQQELSENGVRTRCGQFASRALIVESGNVKKTQAWREGHVVIQDESSQLVAELLAPRPGMRVLDVCAAPGMKLIQIAAALGHGTLIAYDVSATRIKTLDRLARKQIPPAVHLEVRQMDATLETPSGGPFDAVLVDAPCTGTGTLARNPEIKFRLKPGDLERLHEIQTNILCNALAVLAAGGRLVYATCSLEPEENQQVIEEALGSLPRFRLLSAPELNEEFPHLAPFFEEPGYFRTRPGEYSLDGFFAAVIIRAPTTAVASVSSPTNGRWLRWEHRRYCDAQTTTSKAQVDPYKLPCLCPHNVHRWPPSHFGGSQDSHSLRRLCAECGPARGSGGTARDHARSSTPVCHLWTFRHHIIRLGEGLNPDYS
ncbi:MAG: 16S rRNA (cytosine(967)-C(5))-methyltransferase RsmB, partial [Terriglobia bacterium]